MVKAHVTQYGMLNAWPDKCVYALSLHMHPCPDRTIRYLHQQRYRVQSSTKTPADTNCPGVYKPTLTDTCSTERETAHTLCKSAAAFIGHGRRSLHSLRYSSRTPYTTSPELCPVSSPCHAREIQGPPFSIDQGYAPSFLIRPATSRLFKLKRVDSPQSHKAPAVPIQCYVALPTT
jgi:hypothetical protein